MSQNDEALTVLRTIDSDSRFPARVAHTARRDLLLCLTEQDPYPEELCKSLEHYLLSVLLVALNEGSYESTKTQWAVAKSQLKRAAKDAIPSVIQQFAAA